MKKFLLLYFIFSFTSIFAQNWQPFPLGQKSFYLHYNLYQNYYNASDTVLNEFMVDSLRDYGTFQTLYFNFKIPNIDTCYHNIISTNGPGNFFYFSKHDNERPDSITVVNNVYTFYFNKYDLTPENNFIFKPLTQKDSSWTFSYLGSGYDELKLTCDSIYFDTIIGTIVDSVRLFSVQALNTGNPVSNVVNQNKYILSKNYGFKLFKNFPLLGLENSSNQAGFNAPKFDDYFHPNIGDVLIWKEEFLAPPWPGNPPSYVNYYKDSIENVVYSSDTLTYSTIRTYSTLTVTTSGYQRIRSVDNVAFSVGTSTLAPKINFYTDLDEVSAYFIKNGIVHKDRINEFKYLENNCSPKALWDYNWWESYNTKYGVYSYGNFNYDQSWSWKIIGSTINGIQEGVLWSTLVTGINSFETNNVAKIYPNPNKGIFTIEAEKLKTIEILSIEGKILLSQIVNQNATIIKTDLPKGMYFVKLTFGNNQQEIQKIVIIN